MTIIKLHKLLGKLIEEGHGRKRVCVDKPSFSHPLESDGVAFIDVEELEIQTLNVIDDDGGTKTRADGSESYWTQLVLMGPGDPTVSIGAPT